MLNKRRYSMRFSSDAIDEASEIINGHTNWAYFGMLSNIEKERALRECTVVVFFNDEGEGFEKRED